MSRLDDTTALVTGASKGIGAGIAKELGAAGAAVVVNYASDRVAAEAVVSEINRNGGRATAIAGDVSKSADVARLLAETKTVYGTLDILVNNAGVYAFGPLESASEAEFHRQFNTNVLGTLMVIQESLKHFSPNGASVINIGSLSSRMYAPYQSIYAASKAAVDAITSVLAKELAPRRIRVNSVNPGATLSEGARSAGVLGVGGDVEKQLVAMTPLDRIGTPSDIAKVVRFLASSESSWLTGEIILASGGLR